MNRTQLLTVAILVVFAWALVLVPTFLVLNAAAKISCAVG